MCHCQQFHSYFPCGSWGNEPTKCHKIDNCAEHAMNSFDVLRVHFAPSLINALAIILPDVNPSQSICVVIEIDFLDFNGNAELSPNRLSFYGQEPYCEFLVEPCICGGDN